MAQGIVEGENRVMQFGRDFSKTSHLAVMVKGAAREVFF